MPLIEPQTPTRATRPLIQPQIQTSSTCITWVTGQENLNDSFIDTDNPFIITSDLPDVRPLGPHLPDFSLVLPKPAATPTSEDRPNRTTTDRDGADETELVQQFDVDGASAEDILGYEDRDEDENEDYDDEEAEELEKDNSRVVSDLPRAYKKYQASVRVEAAKRAEGNRRAGGLKTQKAMVRSWDVSKDFKFPDLIKYLLKFCICLVGI
jgi:hypothetical protein